MLYIHSQVVGLMGEMLGGEKPVPRVADSKGNAARKNGFGALR